MRLVKKVFDQLLIDLIKHFKEKCIERGEKIPTKKGELYGYAFKKPTKKPNLIDTINNKREVDTYLIQQDSAKIPRKYLYNLERAFKEDTVKTDLDEADAKYVYIEACTIFLGFTNFRAYLNHPGKFEQEVVEAQEIRLEYRPEVLTQYSTLYTGYYYSYRQYKIKTIELSIDFMNGSNNLFPAYLKGLHDQEGARRDIKYRGYASKRAGDYLMVELEGENGYPLTMLGPVAGKEIADCEIIFTAMQGLSVNGYPISMEIVLLKQEMTDNGLKLVANGSLENLYLYLQLQRRNFRVTNRQIESLSYLRARRNDVRVYTSLQGTYRLWNYSKSGNVIQSRFTIENNFCGYLETIPDYVNEKKQVSLISISDAREKKLCVSTHQEMGISVINYIILDIGNKKNGFMDGVFASVGPRDIGVLADYLVAMKDDSEFEAMEIGRKKLARILKRSPQLNVLNDRLYKLCRERRDGITFLD